MASEMQITIEMPFDINFTSEPYHHHCHSLILTKSKHDSLGMKVEICKTQNKPMLQSCLAGHPGVKIPLWQQQLKGSYITAVNDMSVKCISDIHNAVKYSKQMKLKDINDIFSTIEPQVLHPDYGIPQLYHDQLNVIANHIFDIQHDQPQKKIMHCFETSSDDFCMLHEHIINKVKKKFNTFTLHELQKREDWLE